MPITEKPAGHHHYGWRRSKPDHRDHYLALPSIALPQSVDLRGKCPPVYDQGALGSCTANAIAGVIEFDQIKEKIREFTPSRLFIYYCERWIEGTIREDAGAELRDGLKAVAQWGYPPESDWRYAINMFTARPSAKVFKEAAHYRISNYTRVPQVRQQMQQVLASGFPFVAGFTCYESLEADQTAQTGLIPMPAHGESMIGGHAIAVVGYDNAKQLYTIRNSWGEGWGDKGYGYLPYAYLENPNLADDFWAINAV
jgi:C1A family cysteine protease